MIPHGWYIHIQKGGKGPVMLWNGRSFTNQPDLHPKPFASETQAVAKAKSLKATHAILGEYKIWISQQLFGNPDKSRRVNPRKKTTTAPRRAITLKKAKEVCRQQGWPDSLAQKLIEIDRKRNPDWSLEEAAKLYEDFSGHKPTSEITASPRSEKRDGLVIGELDLIGYRAKRDGKTERYGHHFRKSSRPLLAVTSDGKQLHIVGGQYEFTEAGIEDR